jgi:hypothetical protein
MWDFVLAILLPAIGLTGGTIAWGWYGRRNERSIASRGGAFKITPIDNYVAPQDVEGIPNSRIRFFFKYGILSLVFFLTVFCPVIYLYVEDPGLLLFQNPFLFLMSIVILIQFTVTISLFGFSYGYLYEIALDDTGLTARYRNGNRIGYRWTDIIDLKRPVKKAGNTPDSEESIVLELSNGQVDSFSTLTTTIAEAAETTYNKNKPKEESNEKDRMISVLRKKLETTKDPEKRALIQQLLDHEDRPGSDESAPEAETSAEPLPESPPAEGGVSREKGTERPSPGLDLPAPKVIANDVHSAEGPAFRFVALMMGILAVVLVMIFRSGIGNPASEGAAIIVVMMLGIFLAVGLRLGIFVAFHYYKVAVSVRLFNEGFSVAYRRGSPKEFRWSGISSILSSTDIDPVRNPGKVHSIIVTKLNGEDVRLDGLSREVAEGLGNLFNSMKPNISRIVLRAKYRGATEDEAQKLFLDLVVDGKEAYDQMPENWR